MKLTRCNANRQAQGGAIGITRLVAPKSPKSMNNTTDKQNVTSSVSSYYPSYRKPKSYQG
ncbi:MAG TPA: hypothetical protein DCE42_16720 [Myxococcales bacterium]|nr:hypothetical protein [Deltaproteobacteria bacterium]MBU53966.1 hypothetical protein [Deltaproteobacteria bacterium]HAA56411.1 hypothetical protein [Myxococcales bacterium]